MFIRRISAAGLLVALGLGTAACTDGYGGYGYSGVSLGYSSGGYGGGYYDDGYYGGAYYDGGYYDGAYGSPYWGWYGDYYYPGTGYYVYDRNRRPHRWNDGQRRYWETRRGGWRGERGAVRPNWREFGGDRQGYRNDRRDDNGSWGRGNDNRDDRRGDRRERRRDRRD